METSDLLCLYSSRQNNYDLPYGIKFANRFGKSNSIILVDTFIGNFMCNTLTVTEEMRGRRIYMSKCAEKILGNLTIMNCNEHWIDDTTTGLTEKSIKRCMELSEHYGISKEEAKALSVHLCLLRDAFIEGFYNVVGREGLISMFYICRWIIGIPFSSIEGLRNIGGGNRKCPDSISILKAYEDLRNADGEKLKNMLHGLDEGIKKCYVPDVAMFNGDKRITKKIKYYIIGEVKSFVDGKISFTHVHQAWHQSLRGLLDYNCAYGVLICPTSMSIFKLHVNDSDVLKTYQHEIIFSTAEECQGSVFRKYKVNFENFLTALDCLAKIVQEYSTD